VYKLLLLCFLGLILISSQTTAKEMKGTSPYGELLVSQISRGTTLSIGGKFYVTSSLNETLIGQSSSTQGSIPYVINSGLLKPNNDLIFLNNFE